MGWQLINSHHYWCGYGPLVERNIINYYATDNPQIWTNYDRFQPDPNNKIRSRYYLQEPPALFKPPIMLLG